jgi:hypothetical protein
VVRRQPDVSEENAISIFNIEEAKQETSRSSAQLAACFLLVSCLASISVLKMEAITRNIWLSELQGVTA